MKIALQLYSVRDYSEKDLMKTLEQVKAMGYDGVEFAGFFGFPAAEIAAKLKELGMDAVSSHYPIDSLIADPEGSIAYHKTLGTPFFAIPWMPEERRPGNAKYEETVEFLNKTIPLIEAEGMELLYHNHDFEFVKLEDGRYALEKMYDDIPHLNPQFDTCWVRYAGLDPSKYITKYNGRCKIIHLKDFFGSNFSKDKPAYALIGEPTKSDSPDRSEGFEFRPVGHGVQDFKSIIKTAMGMGIYYYIVEQDLPVADSMEDAKKSIDYLRSLDF